MGIEFVKGFMKTKHRGPDDSTFYTESSVDLDSLNQSDLNKVSFVLSRSEIASYKHYTFVSGYHRLALTDASYDATQPFIDPIKNKIMKYQAELKNRPIRKLLCNGEIYNYDNLKLIYNFSDKDLVSNCDVEIILPMYINEATQLDSAEQGIVKILSELDGDFAFVITENINTYITSTINAFACVDFLGVKPLYYVRNKDNTFWMFVSELKSVPGFMLNNHTYNITRVPPGSYWSFQNILNGGEDFIKYYDFSINSSVESCNISDTNADALVSIYENVRKLISTSTIKRYTHSDTDIGMLLSGGFDCCILVGIICRYLIENNQVKTLHLFSIGDTLGSDDLDIIYAKQFVTFLEDNFKEISIEHHLIYMNDIDILASDVNNVIYHLETFDAETVRKSLPFYYLFKYISKYTKIKVLLSGDGLDELCGYYQYEDYSDEEYQVKSVQILSNMYTYDLLRTDRMSQAFGMELRHPYLEKSLVEYILSIHPKLKRHQIYKNSEGAIEKYIIRKAFDNSISGFIYIPDNILWRRSSGICNSLTNFELRLKNYFDLQMSDTEYNNKLCLLIDVPGINHLTLPKTKEEMFYRNTFDKLYPNRSYLVPIFWGDQF